MVPPSSLYLGAWSPLDAPEPCSRLDLPSHHLITHGVVVGMTGSGKTGLLTVLVEDALRPNIPVLMVDVKGDLPNLLLAFPSLHPGAFLPWVESTRAANDPRAPEEIAAQLAIQRQTGLAGWGLGEAELNAYDQSTAIRVITPGSSAGEPLHILSSLERRSERWDRDPESARAALSAAISLVLRRVGREPDPAKSREHVLLSVLAELRMVAGAPAELRSALPEGQPHPGSDCQRGPPR